MIDQARLDRLDPLDRANFDAQPIAQWWVTWPDGSTEVVSGHFAHVEGSELMTFGFSYLGTYRVINLRHTRDVERLPDTAVQRSGETR